MKVNFKHSSAKAAFAYSLDKDDTSGPFQNYLGAQRQHHLANKSADFAFSKSLQISRIHPDLVALCCLLMFSKVAKTRIVLNKGVTKSFHGKCKQLTGIEILPVDPNLKPRKFSKDFKPALAFSAGTDSVAALKVMPDNTELIFLSRINDKKSQYDKSAALEICNRLIDRGRTVHIVESDLEYLIEPETFIHPIAQLIPAILLADIRGYDSIAHGNTLENLFNLHNNHFVDSKSNPIREFDELFTLCGLANNHAVASISTYGTTMIQTNSEYKDLAQSCMYGESLGAPCNACMKCFTKTSFRAIHDKSNVDDYFIGSNLRSNPLAKELKLLPMHLQCAYMYIAANLQTKHEMIRLLKLKTGASKHKVAWMESIYTPALELIPAKYRKTITLNLHQYMSDMNYQTIKRLESWNITGQHSSLIRQFWHIKFWQSYGRIYDHHLLRAEPTVIELKAGSKQILKIKRQTGLFRWEDITSKVTWGSQDSSVAYAKKGIVKAKNTGSTQLRARYGQSVVQVSTKVS